ncbi:FAD/NAD(P)-binding domain-containing protein [Apiospora arundinis]
MDSLIVYIYYLPIITLLVVIFKSTKTVLYGPLSKLPGPWYTNCTDAVLRCKAIRGMKAIYVDNLHKEYGSVVRISPSDVSLRDPSVTRQIYNVKGEFLKAEFYDRLSGGTVNVFNTRDVEVHRRWRRLLSAGMTETSLVTHPPVVEGKIRFTMQRMQEEMEQQKADVFHWFLCMATDIIGELSFGESFRMLETRQKNQFLEDLAFTNKAGGIRVNFPFLIKLGQYIPIPVIKDAIVNRERACQYTEQAIARHSRLVEEKGEETKPTLLSKLYKAGEDGMSFHEVCNNAVAYVLAGSDTTANTLTYLVWEVCKNAEIKERLHEEVLTLPENYGYDEVKALPYLNLVIEEALRLYPAGPAGLQRDVPPGGAEFMGHYIPSGYVVGVGAYSMHHNPSVFPDPERFDPSRWYVSGANLARMELRLATARFFKTFPNARVSSAEGFCDADMEPEMYFMLSPKSKRCLIEV